jgi:hypothetical protein
MAMLTASTGESTRRQNPEERHHPHRRENLRFNVPFLRFVDVDYRE